MRRINKTRTAGNRRNSKPVRHKPRAQWGRALHFGEDEIWRYKVTARGIEIHSPDGVKSEVGMSAFTGWSWTDLERASWKKYTPPVKPSEVKAYIGKNLRGDK